MTSRKKGRRHKGSHRQVKGPGTFYWLDVYRLENQEEPTEVENVIAYWRKAVIDPLFVYFVTESPTFNDHYGIYTEEELEDLGAINPTAAFKAVKIGKARDPLTRLSELQCGNPRWLRLEYLILGAPETERWLHKHWGFGAGIRGEWYGNRYYDAILAVAETTSKAQIAAHEAGESLLHIMEHIPKDVATNNLGKEDAAWSSRRMS